MVANFLHNINPADYFWRSNSNEYTHFIYVFDLQPLDHKLKDSGDYSIQKICVEKDLIKLHANYTGMNGYTFQAYFKRGSEYASELEIFLVKDASPTLEDNKMCLKIRRNQLGKSFTDFTKIKIFSTGPQGDILVKEIASEAY